MLADHADLVEASEVDDDAAIVRRASADSVAAATDRQGDPLSARVAQRLDNLIRALWAEHEPR
jgi:hypothetical protein